MNIRNATSNDCQAIAQIYNQYVGKATMDLTRKEEKYYQDWLASKEVSEELIVAENGGKLVGWGIIKRYSDREGYRYACETSVFVDSEERQKGYGKMLKTHIMELCRKMGYKHLVAKIWRENKVSIDYNLKLGYTIVGVQKNIGFVEDRWIDVVIMQYNVES